MKYKEYACSYGSIFVYEDGDVEFVPYEGLNNPDYDVEPDQEVNVTLDIDALELCDLIEESETELP